MYQRLVSLILALAAMPAAVLLNDEGYMPPQMDARAPAR